MYDNKNLSKRDEILLSECKQHLKYHYYKVNNTSIKVRIRAVSYKSLLIIKKKVNEDPSNRKVSMWVVGICTLYIQRHNALA